MRVLTLALPLVLAACISGSGTDKGDGSGTSETPTPVDTDGDGISDGDEEAAGTDPEVSDSDGDGLEDGAEVELGTDPLSVDTDADGYSDADEGLAGTDPLDETSVIYVGGWPYNADKDTMTEGDASGRAGVGDTVPHFIFQDQFGDMVDIYDFAQQGKPMIIDLSGAWCYWCQQAAKLIEGDESDLSGYGYDGLQEIIENGTIYWITILDANKRGAAASESTVTGWYDDYPNPYVPVLADTEAESTAWINPSGYPTMMFVDENMVVQVFKKADYTKAFDAALEYADSVEAP